MLFSANYIEKSLYYLPWKTKFIEVFCILYARFLRNVQEKCDVNVIVDLYFELFKLMINILQKKLKSDNITVIFYPEIINCASKHKYISNKCLCFDVLNFLSQYNLDKNNAVNFKYEYIDILNDFSKRFKQFTKQEGNREKNYTIYDNSYCLWGIREKSYIKLVKEFFTYKQIKIVRIFGSRVTDNYREFSDIDLIFEGTYSEEDFYKIRNKIQNLELPYVLDMYDISIGNKPFTYRNTIRSNIFYSRKDYCDDTYASIINT